MAALIQIPINFSALNTPRIASIGIHSLRGLKSLKPSKFHTLSSIKIESFYPNRSKFGAFKDGLPFLEVRRGKVGNLLKNRVVLVKFFNGLGDGGGGGGRDNSETVTVVTNIALATVLVYLTVDGQLGWLWDAFVSIWLLAVLAILGFGVFLWWTGRDIVIGTCPNCGNDFQALKSPPPDNYLQLCPFCSQPFSVVGDKFVRDPVTFSNQSTAFGQAFNNFTSSSKKGEKSSVSVVDVEAEVKDAD